MSDHLDIDVRPYHSRPSLAMRAVTAVLRSNGEKRILSDANRTEADSRKKATQGPKRPPRWMSRSLRFTEERIDSFEVMTVEPHGISRAACSLVYLHGGAYVYPLLTAHWWMVAALVRATGMRVHVVYYPLAPEGTAGVVVPAVADLLDSVRLRDGVQPVLAGDSAGGGLALAATNLLRHSGRSQPSHLLLIAPWLDAAMRNPRIPDFADADPSLAVPGLLRAARLWSGGLALDDPLVSPGTDSGAGLCPTTLVVGTADLFYPDCAEYAARCQQQGVDLALLVATGGFHAFACATRLPESRAALQLVKSRLRSS